MFVNSIGYPTTVIYLLKQALCNTQCIAIYKRVYAHMQIELTWGDPFEKRKPLGFTSKRRFPRILTGQSHHAAPVVGNDLSSW